MTALALDETSQWLFAGTLAGRVIVASLETSSVVFSKAPFSGEPVRMIPMNEVGSPPP